MYSAQQQCSLCALLVTLATLTPLAVGQPSLTSTSVYPFAPFFTVQPSNASGSSGVQLTPYGAYAFAYVSNSQSQVNSMTLPCAAEANPSPTYTWKINGTLVQSNSQYSYSASGVGDLTISPLSPGIYQCIATSGSSVAYSDIVNLTAAYLQIVTQTVTRTISINQGAYYRMPQDAIGYKSFPPPIISWQRDNNQITSNLFNFESVATDNRVIIDELGRLHITYAQQTDCCSNAWVAYLNNYRLRYQLAQTNLQFTPLLTTLTVASSPSPSYMPIMQQYITPSPVNAISGTSIRIVCVYSGTPPIVVNYYKVVNGTSVQITGDTPNVLVIYNAQLNDSGTYQCQATQTSATSGTGNMSPQTISVNVMSPPQWTSKPVDSFVPVGGQITLPCAASGNPAVTVQWLVNGAQVTNDAKQMVTSAGYTLMDAQKPNDNRAVQCVVQNGYAAYTANAAITVITPTQITSSPVNYLQIQPGAIVTFACEAVGDPLLNTYITWYWTDIYSNVHVLDNSPPGIVISMNKNGSDSQESLTVDTNQFNDKNLVRGSYTCVASNGWSTTNATGRISFYGDADGLVTASFDLWIIGVIVGVLVLIAIIVLIVVCCLRNRGGTYGVDEKERAQGNNPTEDLKKMHGFTEYVRPDSQPVDGSRTGTLKSTAAPAASSAYPPPEYPVPPEPDNDIGEDGSFRGAYGSSSPRQSASPYASANAAFQPPAYGMSSPPSAPPRNKPLPPPPGNEGIYYGNSINDSMV